ncbi:tetratricopeptide repeat protein [Leptolyngbya sp. NIES-2104]|uniref:tetratricopeptide repeat protein n=1 Tax=Leptolyngbya sp. NIES-2104 TaxID=1552121 RepID=UPI0006EC6D23|nr:tetratricopeptide repeat protein [Leptolyngbya sp. NIES-2104]GAP97761.1 TPR domain protein, putative component of TonB system [Leptolyngbya sp. NIES-2104]
MFAKLWRWLKQSFRHWFGTRSQVEPAISPVQQTLSAAEYEAVFFALLNEVERRSEFNRGWIRGFLQQRGVTREGLAEWLRGFGERLQGGEEHRELGERLLRLGRLQEGELCWVAESIGQRLERENRSQAPNDEAEAWFERGNECYRAGNFEGAIVSYDKVLDIKPDLPGVRIIRGISLDNLGRYEDAIASYDKALGITSDLPEVWIIRGDSLHNLGRDEDAVASFDKALDIEPNYQALYNRGISLHNLGRCEDAVASFDKALDIESDSHAAWCNRGSSLHNLGRDEDAIASFDKALDIKPDLDEAWYNRGILLNDLDRYEDAIASFDKALHIKPGKNEAWNNRSISLHNLGQYEDAIVSCDKALDIKPDNHSAWTNRGNSLHNLGQYEDAIVSCDKAIKIKPDFHAAWYNRGISLDNLGRYEGAIANYNQGLTHVLKEADPEGWGNLHRGKGNTYFYQAQREQNIQAAKIYYGRVITSYNTARQTLESFPKHYLELIQNLIKAYLGLGNPKAADKWHVTGLEVFRQLINAQSTPLQKRNLEAKFSGFSQIAVDRLIAQDETITALETAERYKNRCLTWILDEWKEQVVSPSYAEMRQLLNPQTAIVYWHFSDDSLATFILTPTSEDPILLENALPYDRCQKLQSWIKSWNTQYNDYRNKKANQSDHPWRRSLKTQLAKLKEILQISAIESHLSNIQNLILLPHRDLHRFPLHALFSETLAVSYLPSLQIGLTLQKKPRSTHLNLLSVEDPKTDRAQMPYAQLESALACYLFPHHTRLDETKATAENVIHALSDQHTHFHFTGHAGYNTPPEHSALILTDDEPLTAKTIRHLNLTAYELITLSACETALTGNQSIDTEFVGLVSAFLQAGATAVLSTLWNVNEISNTWLILKFYELYPEIPAAQALKTAQTWLRSLTYQALLEWLDRWLTQLSPNHDYHQDIQDEITLIQENLNARKIELQDTPYSDPYHWAAFTLTGTHQ